MFLLKLPMKILALPVILVLTLVQWLGVLAAGVSSIALRLIGFAAVMTAVGIWMFQLGTNADAYRMLGFGILLVYPPLPDRRCDSACCRCQRCAESVCYRLISLSNGKGDHYWPPFSMGKNHQTGIFLFNPL